VNAPTWLTDLLVVALLAMAGFFVWRMVVANAWRRRADYPSDALHALAALAVAETQVKWVSTLPRPAWAVVFAVAAVYFAVVAFRAHRESDAVAERNRGAADTGLAVALVYMFTAGVAPSALSGSSAGSVVMAGMPGMMMDSTVRYPTLGLLLVAAAIGYTVVLLDRLSTARRVVVDTPAGTPVDPMDRPGPLPMFAPRTVECCRIVLLLAAAYAILAKLV